MKRIVFAVACAALAGCPDKKVTSEEPADAAVGPLELAETEPNDKADQALTLSRSSRVVAALSAPAEAKRPDEDWYLLAPERPGQVDLEVSGVPGADLVVSLFDQDQNPLLTLNSGGEGEGERFPNLGVLNPLLVKVSAAKKGGSGAYTLTATFTDREAGFEAEPNDRAVDATALSFEVPVQGFLAHGADVDWYRLEMPAPPEPEEAPEPPSSPEQTPVPEAAAPPVPAPPPAEDEGEGESEGEAESETFGEAQPAAPAEPEQPAPPAAPDPAPMGGALRVEVTPVPGARVEVALLTEAEAPLFEVKGVEGEALTLRNIGFRQSDRVLYVVVKSAWSGTGKAAKRGFNAEAPYTLSVSLEAAGAKAEYEPNDEVAHATPLAPNGFREGFLSPKTDRDFYVLRTDGPALATLQLSGTERLDLALEVVRPKPDGSGTETLLRANDGEVKEPEQLNNVACPGECYVVVEGASRKVDGKWVRDFENAEVPYRLSVTTTPDTGAEEREPNNTADTATAVGLGQPIRGTIQPRKDVDLYRLDLSGRMVRTPLRATLIGILKVDLGLYLHRLEADGTLSLVQTADRAKGEQPETIRYSAEPGVYVFEVKDSTRRNDANFQDRYQLTVMEEH